MMNKKLRVSLLVGVFCVIALFGIGFIYASGQTITINKILMKDSVGKDNPQDEPKSYEEVKQLIEYQPSDRTGWSGIIYGCIGGEWIEEKRNNTADASYKYAYSVENYRDEIVSRYGQEVYEQALASGQQFIYDGNGMESIYMKDTRTWPCETGDTAYFYNNNDFYLSLTFTPEEEPTPEPDPEEPEEPQPPIDDKNNLPPVAIIEGPTEVEVGENFCLRSASYDPDGYIVSYQWEVYDSDAELTTEDNESELCMYYKDIGEKVVKLTVWDNGYKKRTATLKVQ